MNGPVRTWYRDGTRAWPRSNDAPPVHPHSRSATAAHIRPGRRIGCSCVAVSTLPLLPSGQRPPAPVIPDPLGPHRPLNRPPELLPVVQGRESPGEIEAEEPERVGPR